MKIVQKKVADGVITIEATATKNEVEQAFHSASILWAQMNGLKPEPNKTPAQVSQERLGIKDLDAVVAPIALDKLTAMAVDKKGVIPASQPKARGKNRLTRGQDFTFDLDITLKPVYELSSYDPVEITVPPFTINEAVVDQQMAEIAKSNMTYVTDEARPLGEHDHCVIAVTCSQDGQELKNITTEGRPYVTGENLMPADFDKNIVGMNPGETREFSFMAPEFIGEDPSIQKETQATVTLKEIQKAQLPVIDDEWVVTHMFMCRGVEDLKNQIRASVEQQARKQYDDYRMGAAASQMGRRVQGSIPDHIYEAARDNLVQNLQNQARQMGISWEDFIRQNGGEQQFGFMLMMQTRENVVQGLALDAVYRTQKLTATDDDYYQVCLGLNPQVNPELTRANMEAGGGSYALREAAERYCANRWVLEHAIIHEQEM